MSGTWCRTLSPRSRTPYRASPHPDPLPKGAGDYETYAPPIRSAHAASVHAFRGASLGQPTVVVELEQDGLRGYGEAPQSPYYGASAAGTLCGLGASRGRGSRLQGSTIRPTCGRSFARCWATRPLPNARWTWRPTIFGASCAAQPLWKLWGLDIGRLPPSDYTIGIDSIDVMLRKLDELPGFPVYKIKLGTPAGPGNRRALRPAYATPPFASTPTAAWTAAEAIAVAPGAGRTGRRADRAAAAAGAAGTKCGGCLPRLALAAVGRRKLPLPGRRGPLCRRVFTA